MGRWNRCVVALAAGLVLALVAGMPGEAAADSRLSRLGQRGMQRARAYLGAHFSRSKAPVTIGGKLRKQLASQAADRHIGKVLDHSRRNGIYFVASDLHLGNGDGREDFRDKGRIPAQTIRWLTDNPAHRGKNVTLVLAGDVVDVMEHIKPGSGLREQKRVATSFVTAHRQDWTALAHAVVDKGLRVVLGVGNHDSHLVDYRLRKHLLNQIATQAGLTQPQRATFHSRVAYSGHAIPYGTRGEVVSVHAHEADAFNSYRSPINPYTADRKFEINVGNLVVWNYHIRRELAHSGRGEGRTNIGTYLRPKAIWQLARLVHNATKRNGKESKAERETKAAHDRYAMKQWVQRTGFHKLMDGPNATAASVEKWTDRWQARQAGLPTPLHNSLGSRLHLVNLIKVIWSRLVYPYHKRKAVGLLTAMQGELGRVRGVTGGHDHRFNHSLQQRRGGGDADWVSFNNTGTMTKEGKGTFVRIETDGSGHVATPPRSLWVDRSTGAPTIPVPAKHANPRWKIKGWEPIK